MSKTYSNKSNAKRAAIKELVKTTHLDEAGAKESFDELAVITGSKEEGFGYTLVDRNITEVEVVAEAGTIADLGAADLPPKKESLFNDEGEQQRDPQTMAEAAVLREEEFEEGNSRQEMTYNEAGDAVPAVEITEVALVENTQNPIVATKREKITIEKNRETRNNVTRPSAGTLCGDVWAACDKFREANDRPPVKKEVDAIAKEQGWNANNTTIEYYNWRKFNGIKGRIKI